MLKNVTFEYHEGRWVVWDNDINKAHILKQNHPYDPVYIYNHDTGEYTQYTITVTHHRPHMSGGKLTFEAEELEI